MLYSLQLLQNEIFGDSKSSESQKQKKYIVTESWQGLTQMFSTSEKEVVVSLLLFCWKRSSDLKEIVGPFFLEGALPFLYNLSPFHCCKSADYFHLDMPFVVWRLYSVDNPGGHHTSGPKWINHIYHSRKIHTSLLFPGLLNNMH